MSRSLKYYICFFMLIAINLLFSIKYISRASDYYVYISLIVVLVLSSVLIFRKKLKDADMYLHLINWGLVVAYILLGAIIFYTIPVDSLNVDRWSVITSFWQNYEVGEYVYYAKSNVGNPPGPMPFYYLLAYPFYLVGELGFFSLAGMVVFTLLLIYCKTKRYIVTSDLLFLILSPFLIWEVTCRSNIFLNGSLVLFSLVYFLREDRMTTQRLLLSAIFFGLLLSTRNVFCIAFITVGIYALRWERITLGQMLCMIAVGLAVFAATFLPFVVNFWDDFFVVNPFIIQSTFLMPIYYTLIFIVLSFLFGYLCKNNTDVYFYTALNLFLCILTYFMYQASIIGMHEAVFGRIADISYFIFCVPFALLYISNDIREKNNRRTPSL